MGFINRKKHFILISFILMMNSIFSIGIELINIRNIPNYEMFEEEFQYIFQNEYYVEVYIPDEYWQHDVSKQEIANEILLFCEKLEDIDNSNMNQDFDLLKGLLYFYLYNLDQQGFLSKSITQIESIANYQNPDYRYLWFLGAIYSASNQSYNAINNFKYIEERIPEDKIHPMFWYDYAIASSLALMPSKSLDCYEKLGEYSDYDLQNDKFYIDHKNSFIRTSASDFLEKNDVFSFFEYEDGPGVVSRPLGIWLPVKYSWNPILHDYKDNFSAIRFYSEPITNERAEAGISYTINAFFFSEYEDIISKFDSLAPDMQVIQSPEFDPKYTVLEMQESDKYVDRGGAHGYVVIYEVDLNDSKTIEIEEPVELDYEKNGNLQYYHLDQNYLRMNGKISYVFLLDSYEYIFEESKKDFIDFLSKVKILEE